MRSWHCLRQEGIGCRRPPTRRSPPSSSSSSSSPSSPSSPSLAQQQSGGSSILCSEAGEVIISSPLGPSQVASVGDGSGAATAAWSWLLSGARPRCPRGTSTLARTARESSLQSPAAADIQHLTGVPKNLVVGTNPTVVTHATHRTAIDGCTVVSISSSCVSLSPWGVLRRHLPREFPPSVPRFPAPQGMGHVASFTSSKMYSTVKSATVLLPMAGRRLAGGGGGTIRQCANQSTPKMHIGPESRRFGTTGAAVAAGGEVVVPRGLGGSGLGVSRALPRGRIGEGGSGAGMATERRGRAYSTATETWSERVKATMRRIFGPTGESKKGGTSSSLSSVIPGSAERTRKAIESLTKNPPRVADAVPARSESSGSPLARLSPSSSVGGRIAPSATKSLAPRGTKGAAGGGVSEKALAIMKGWGLAPAVAAKEAGLKYRQAVALHVEGFWKRNNLILVGAGGVIICLLLWRVMFGIASIFVNFSERMASMGFLALAAAMVTLGGLGVRRAYTINPDVVYRRAMRMINTSPAVLEVMGAPLTGTDVRAYVMSGGRLRIKNFKPRLSTKRVYLIFPVRGAERRGLVSVEAKKKKGKYEFKLVAVDVPTAGAEQRLFLIGDEAIYKSGGGLISELRDPIVTAMRAQKEFEDEDDKEEEDDERRRKAEEKRLAEEEEQKLKDAASVEEAMRSQRKQEGVVEQVTAKAV
ncbi:hypothetical protein CBR_g29882 [Chara braunii]|uniref:Uncharacterized protein n=1 Tax=Chara braunii TaxID=69332 RepID=A0A388JWT3_CHABU|nr:hypothetical protein CBR_g29882 [Chara braunii]|eukprot:GBG62274.1 hypothetical protein CBR_g29882 [Chara braunii]